MRKLSKIQGKWDDAAKEYEAILQAKPDVAGIHFRLGRLLSLETAPDAGSDREGTTANLRPS